MTAGDGAGTGNDDASVPSVDLPAAHDAIATASPLVTALTNVVTSSETANVTLHWGGLPVMSEDERDAVELVAAASACLFNMGTVDEAEFERMLAVGEAAAERDLPVVFDPVGVGATERRTEIAERIVADVDLAVVNGNYGEVSALAGEDAAVRGVESVGEYGEIAETAIACARRTDAVVVASGEVDVVATADAAYELSVGHELMGQFVGTGCMLGATLATFAGAADAGTDAEAVLEPALAGAAAFGLAGERAAADGEYAGPASYRTAFMDAIASFDASAADDVDERLELAAEV